MLQDVGTVLWKEWREIIKVATSGEGRPAMLAFFMIIYGVLNPWAVGGRYLTGFVPFMGMGSVLLVVTISVTVDAFAGERERHTLETLLSTRLSDEAILLGKLSASIIY